MKGALREMALWVISVKLRCSKVSCLDQCQPHHVETEWLSWPPNGGIRHQSMDMTGLGFDVIFNNSHSQN